jgi:serine/threonine-protein kinase
MARHRAQSLPGTAAWRRTLADRAVQGNGMTIESAEPIERKRRAFALLREALDVEEAARGAWIVQRCANDAATAAELRTLLASPHALLLDREVGALAAALIEAAEADDDALPADARIGAWKLLRRLGSGGMGTVYLAERIGDGYAQRGALKLIKRGMDSAAVLARFRRERQILSQLSHPNIAHLLDGGIAEGGQPFLVMEYVDGTSLADWAQRTNASLDARVALFLELGDAVAHAHRRLVVHRDIKPGNVLVDDAGHPHLLDFGIAKLLEDGDAAERTLTMVRFVSRAYAAPEQTGDGEVTTATDVYQLGVLLFELLTGTRYGDAPTSKNASQHLARAQAQAAQASPIDPRQLQGDAGVIVARATDIEPARRYATVEAFVDDVRRWRSGRPIRARPDSAAYRLRLFVRRNRLLVGIAALALVAMLGGAGIALWQARIARAEALRATAEAASARASQRFMLTVFTQAEPWRNGGRQPTALDLAQDALARIDTELAGEPAARADMYHALSRLFSVAGDVRLSAVAADKAVATLEAMPAADGERLYQARLRLAYGYFYASDFAHAQALLIRLENEEDGRHPLRDYTLMGLRASLARDRGRVLESARLTRQIAEAAPRIEGVDAGEAWWHLAEAERTLGRYAQTLDAERRSREQRERLNPDASPLRVGSLLWAWNLAADTDAPAQALHELAPLVARLHGIFGDSVYTAQALLVYARAQRQLDRDEVAERLLREAVRVAENGSGGTPFDAAAPRVELASTLVDLGRFAEASPLLDAASKVYAGIGDADDPRLWLVRLIRARTDPRDPGAALREAWDEHRPDHLRERPEALRWQAEAEARAGRHAAARARWHEVLAELDRQGRPLSAEAWRAHAALATLPTAADAAEAAHEERIACAQAALLFDAAADAVRRCGRSAPGQDSSAWPRPMYAQFADIGRLRATVDAASALDAADVRWLSRLERGEGDAAR